MSCGPAPAVPRRPVLRPPAQAAADAERPPSTPGTADGLVGVNRQFRDWLNTRDVKLTYTEIPDIGHVWPLWRQNLTDLAPLLFRM